MKKERKFSFKGVDVKFDINMESLIGGLREELKSRYKNKIDVLKELVRKRNEYIINMHNILRHKDSAMFIMLDAVHIYKKANSIYRINEKQMMILSYMCRTNMANRIHVSRYLKSIGYAKMVAKDADLLKERGFLIEVKEGFFGITDKGRKIIDNVYNAFKQDYAYFKKNQAPVQQHEEKRVIPRKFIPEEERDKKRQFYRAMMQPFWEYGLKKMPKDGLKRVEYINKYVKKLIELDMRVDPIYDRLIEKWSVPKKQIPRELSK
jgi:predicted transcriptional regulator